MKKARLKDVAVLAGVSQGTVSNVFNRPELVREELRERVLAAAKKIGFRGPAPAGRVLRSGRSNLIALVVDASLHYILNDPFGQKLLSGIAEVCDAEHIGLTIVSADAERRDGWSIESAIVDGFILFCITEDNTLVELARRRGLPFVAVDSGEVPGAGAVDVDDRTAAAEAARHLTGLGHRRIGILSLEMDDKERTGLVDEARFATISYTTPRSRLLGYRDAFAEADVDPADVVVYECLNDAPSVEEAIRVMFAPGREHPTALLAMSDTMALAACGALARMGLSVPHDVSIVGFDDVPEAERASPPLTTIRQPVEEKGRVAARMLLAGEREHRVLPTSLVVRASTIPAPSEKRSARAAREPAPVQDL
ncbi:LacI family DNA-binding transcriptional regulator [Salinarimonas ramus]|uniref:LacI family transcriptional regulator n=1 Tax=Salinarimonas ramus TaxID=690164 RepID=A0A917Q6B4_9HYPH|nr:LacI family DNA-binding transcriptional regulator [Salinarimonas ramus]GGK29673.1 LacI family transcriptional regulator [Salinarimonas ramus]